MIQCLIENTSVSVKNRKFRASRSRVYDENDGLNVISPELGAVILSIPCVQGNARGNLQKMKGRFKYRNGIYSVQIEIESLLEMFQIAIKDRK